jgi:hypothetical protein
MLYRQKYNFALPSLAYLSTSFKHLVLRHEKIVHEGVKPEIGGRI